MVVAKHASPNPYRRRSIAVLNTSQPVGHRRRPHSIAPGDVLSPRARARGLAPRKSILKLATPVLDEEDATTNLGDTTSRKSFSRRVSFAATASVRLIAARKDLDSSVSSQDSPSRNEDPQPSTSGQNDENAYPGARRRSSLNGRRRMSSLGNGDEESMDLDDTFTGDLPPAFGNAGVGSALDSSDEDAEGEDGEDMEETRPMSNAAMRRRSSIGLRRAALSSKQSAGPDEGADTSQVDMSMESAENSRGDESMGSVGNESAGPMEFTVPLAQALRKPEPPSEAWLALQSATHSGINPPSDEADGDHEGGQAGGMELDDALSRLRKARDSMGFAAEEYPSPRNFLDENGGEPSFVPDDDDFSDSSFGAEDGDEGNQTLNVTALMKRRSLGRMSVGAESAMSLDDEDWQGDKIYPDLSGIEESPPAPAPAPPPAPAPFVPFRDPPALEKPPPSPGRFSAAMSRSIRVDGQIASQPEPAGMIGGGSPASRASTSGEVSATSTDLALHEKRGIFSAPGRVANPSVFSAPGTSSASEVPPRPGSALGRSVFSAPPPRATSAPPSPIKSPSKSRPSRQASAEPPPQANGPAAPTPMRYAFTPRSNKPTVSGSPSKQQAPQFSAAFAPPSARKEPGAMRRASLGQATNAENNAPKRPATEVQRPGPSKLPALSTQIPDSNVTTEQAPAEPTPALLRPSLSAAKRASFDALSATTPGASSAGPRRPSVGRAASLSGQPAIATPPQSHDTEPGPGSAQQNLSPPAPPAQQEVPPTPVRRMSALPPPSPGVWAASPGKAIRPKSPAAARSAARAQPSPSKPRRRSLAEIELEDDIEIEDPTVQWRNGVHQESLDGVENGPSISIEQFMEMTGVKFMDELTAPRRSTIRPSQLRRSLGGDTSSEEASLQDYFTAMTIDIPQLELYSNAMKQLQAGIEHSKQTFTEVNEEAKNNTPELFKEYVEADEDNKNFLLHELKLIKDNCHKVSKAQWYNWKTEWVEHLHEVAERGLSSLQADAEVLSTIVEKSSAILPNLREEYDAVMRELAEEQAAVAEIENCDQDYLEELKATIAEQNLAIEGYRADVADRESKLQRLNEKLADTRVQIQEGNSAIAEAQRVLDVQQGSTIVEVLRMQDELEFIQDIHMWRIVKVHPDYLEAVYDSCIRVAIPCRNFQPMTEHVQVSRVKDKLPVRKDWFPAYNDHVLQAAQRQVASRKAILRHSRDIIQILSDQFAVCALLRKQLHLLVTRYAYETAVAPDGSSFAVTVSLLFERVRTKALVSFTVDTETMCTWPQQAERIAVAVKVAYGSLKPENIHQILLDFLQQNHPADNPRCFSEACEEAIKSCQ